MSKATETRANANGGGSSLSCCKDTNSAVSINEPDVMESGDLGLYKGYNNNVGLGMNGDGPLLRVPSLPKRPPVNIQFSDVTYTTYTVSFKEFAKVPKQILHGVSGEFKSGELSVIMGPSGAGKSTLLNILAGYTTIGTSGTVAVNGRIRDNSKPHRFRRLSAYIQQDDELRPRLTVLESMMAAARLKLGPAVSKTEKLEKVRMHLSTLGLDLCHNTLTSKLSGGQKKRLSIALELLSNPPVLFLDEPTTGLDSSSCGQCVSLLKRLAQDEGRTIICTLHQPSALLFEMFDRLYAVADGRCIYQGPVKELLPFLGTVGLRCPPYHNPADFLMEVSTGEYDADVKKLAEITSGLLTVKNECYPKKKKGFELEMDVLSSKLDMALYADEQQAVIDLMPSSMILQFWILVQRNLTILRRNYKQVSVRILSHVALGIIFGYLYLNVGTAANTILGNYVYLYGSLLFLVYTGLMSVTLNFPLEMGVLTREHFNRWYNLGPYFLATISVEIPLQVACTWMYLSVSYWLTAQPMEEYRVTLFVAFCTLSTLCAQSWGYFIGATTPTKIAVFLGPVIAVLFSVFGFCLRFTDTPVYFRWMYHISYFRAAFHSIVTAIYGMDRSELFCPESQLYCHYAAPVKFLREMDITDIDMGANAGLIVGMGCIMHALTFTALWVKLNKR